MKVVGVDERPGMTHVFMVPPTGAGGFLVVGGAVVSGAKETVLPLPSFSISLFY